MGLVRRIAFCPREYIIGRYVDEQDIVLGAERCEGAGRGDVEGAGTGRVRVAFVGEAVCCTCTTASVRYGFHSL